jgi:hypothetical protein
MRRDAVVAVGGYRAEAFPSEDFDLWLRLNEVGELANIPDLLVRYRRHPDTVRIREHARHRTTAAAIVHAARLKRGLPPLTFRSLRIGTAPRAAVYHFECTGIALKTGMRGPAFRHARATISAAPFWPPPYAALAACVLPKRSLQLLAKVYARFRAIDH